MHLRFPLFWRSQDRGELDAVCPCVMQVSPRRVSATKPDRAWWAVRPVLQTRPYNRRGEGLVRP